MGDIHFDTDQDTFDRAPVGSGEKADLVGWMMQKGIAKNEQQAQYILIGVILVGCVVSYVVWAHSSASHVTTSQVQINDALQEGAAEAQQARTR